MRLALTALTGLTSLVLSRLYDGVGEVEATAIAHSLTQLQDLTLFGCGFSLRSTELLAAVGELKQLTYLQLDCSFNYDFGITPQGLMQLTGLSRLQQLDSSVGVTDALMDSLWAAVRRPQQQQ